MRDWILGERGSSQVLSVETHGFSEQNWDHCPRSTDSRKDDYILSPIHAQADLSTLVTSLGPGKGICLPRGMVTRGEVGKVKKDSGGSKVRQ